MLSEPAPEWLGKALTIVVLLSLLFTTFYTHKRKLEEKARSALPLVAGDVIVRGWSSEQLRAIVGAFADSYDLGPDRFATFPLEDGWMRIVPDKPLAGDRLLYLVNYLHYPREFEGAAASPLAVARFSTAEGFGPAKASRGTRAKASVPVKGQAFDKVHVSLETGATYQVSFADLKWRKITGARTDPRVAQLGFASDSAG